MNTENSPSTKPLKISVTQRALNLQTEIQDYFDKNSYKMICDITAITAKNNPLKYICKCGTEKNKAYKEILSRACRDCNNKKLKETPTLENVVYPTDDPEEKWAPIESGFISSKGRACNVNGKMLTRDEKNRYYIAGNHHYISVLMAKAFNIQGSENLNGNNSNNLVRVKDPENITLDNIYVTTRNELGSINGKKARQSEKFKFLQNEDIFVYINNYEYKIVSELSDHLIFETGIIYNKMKGTGGSRFLTTSMSGNYLQFVSNNKAYKVHRLVCYAFHPLDGYNCLADYEKLHVNHKDGNTTNNNKDNLEWVTQSKNIQHAYDNKLNKKVRPVQQYQMNTDGTQGELIAEFESLAKAARDLNIPEHRIRECARGKSKPKDFIWKYKNEEDNEEWSKKFSSK